MSIFKTESIFEELSNNKSIFVESLQEKEEEKLSIFEEELEIDDELDYEYNDEEYDEEYEDDIESIFENLCELVDGEFIPKKMNTSATQANAPSSIFKVPTSDIFQEETSLKPKVISLGFIGDTLSQEEINDSLDAIKAILNLI